MTFTTLRYEKSERIAMATFSTPENLNGITEARLDKIEAALIDCETDEGIGALTLTGEGRAFCVGLDLDLLDRAFGDLDYFDVIVARVNGIITRLENLNIPTIVANNGFTRAGGSEISLGCDFMIVADEAWIPSHFIRQFGWTPVYVGLRYGSVLMIFGTAGIISGWWIAILYCRRGYCAALEMRAAKTRHASFCSRRLKDRSASP